MFRLHRGLFYERLGDKVQIRREGMGTIHCRGVQGMLPKQVLLVIITCHNEKTHRDYILIWNSSLSGREVQTKRE